MNYYNFNEIIINYNYETSISSFESKINLQCILNENVMEK